MSILETAKTVLALIPEVIKTVKAIEDAMPEGGKGKQKLEVIRSALEMAYTTGGSTLESFNAIWPILDVVVSKIVLLFKK